MEIKEREKDLIEALIGIAKSSASQLPVLGQLIAGYDAYNRSSYDRNVKSLIKNLSEKVENIEVFFQNEFYKSEVGANFARKVINAALDDQLLDKQELFVNILINATHSQSISELEKLKFVDMLRHLSRASLMVLADIHNLLIGQVRGPGRSPDPISAYPLVAPDGIAEKLSHKYDPYLIVSAISEMESQGLFSRTGEWHKDPSTGRYMPGGGFATDMCYTDFSARFVEFIIESPINKIE